MIGVGIHESGDCPHTPAPNADTTDGSYLSQILENKVDIVSFVIAEGDVGTFWQSAACEVEGEDGDIPAEEVVDDPLAK